MVRFSRVLKELFPLRLKGCGKLSDIFVLHSSGCAKALYDFTECFTGLERGCYLIKGVMGGLITFC